MEFKELGIGEECGVFGCLAAGSWPTELDVPHVITLGLVGLQHRTLPRANHPVKLRGGFGSGGRGRGIGRSRGRGRGARGKAEDKEWMPVTKLGRLVKDMKTKSLEEIGALLLT